MGSLLATISGSEKSPIIEIDFGELIVPSDAATLELFNKCTATTEERSSVLQRIGAYRGCQELARKAIQQATAEAELEAFNGLLPGIESVSRFFSFSKVVEQLMSQLLVKLSQKEPGTLSASASSSSPSAAAAGADTPSSPGGSSAPSLKLADSSHHCLARQLADLVAFAMEFDEKRLVCQQLSNDFSYYRRLLSKFERGPEKHPGIIVTTDQALTMSQFTADPNPMITAAVKGIKTATGEGGDAVQYALSILANSCAHKLKTSKSLKEKDCLLVARVMVGAVILFDHSFLPETGGAFGKKSPITIKQCAQQIKKLGVTPAQKETLKAFIKFTSKNYANAGDSLKAEFED
jgi:hypothetical protein